MHRPQPLMLATAATVLALALPGLAQPALSPASGNQAILAPPGTAIEAVATGLDYPVDVTFSETGEMFVAEAGGHTYGDKPEKAPPPRIWRFGRDGDRREIKLEVLPLSVIRQHDSSAEMPEGIITPITGVTHHKGKLYIAHRSRVSTYDLKTGQFKTIINGMPSWGEFLNHKVIVGPDEKLYFVLSTQGNSGVIEEHWAKVMNVFNKPRAHEVPGADVTLTGQNYPVKVQDPQAPKGEKTLLTGVYVPLGVQTQPGQVIKGQVPANGGMHKANADGTNLELVAWGLRSCFGYRFSPDGRRLVATQNSANVMKPREIYNDWEPIYEIKPGTWYGWPDFYSSLPITDPRFSRPNHPDFKGVPTPHKFALTPETHRRLLKGAERPPAPLAKLSPHVAAEGMVFGRPAFGVPEEEILVAEFGNIIPYLKDNWPGYRVQRVNLETGETTDFLVNRSRKPASASGGEGLERPIQLEWGPDGALYVVDFGRIDILQDQKETMSAKAGTGKVWRVSGPRRPAP